MVVWLEDRQVFSHRPCRNFNESSRLPLYCYWATKIKFVFVWAAIQQSPELREFFRHHYFLSMVFQPAWGLWSFRVPRSNWLGHSVVLVALHNVLFHRTEPGRCNQPQSTGKLTGSIVFCSTCASSTTSTLYLYQLRPRAPARVAEAGNRSPPGIQLPHWQFLLIPRTGRSWHGPPSPVFLICKSVAYYETKTVPLFCDKPLNVKKLLLAPMNAVNVW